jgi:VanZ family protein
LQIWTDPGPYDVSPTIRKAALAAFWLLLGLICFATFAPVGLRPRTGHVILERFAAFFALGGSLAFSYPRRPLPTAAVIVAIATGSEALQLLIPTRDARIVDALEKGLGGLAGVVAVTVIARMLLRRGVRG